MVPFIVNEGEAGLLYGWQLYRLARDCGKTPWEMAHDPHLAFNATCQRAYDKVKQMRFGLSMNHARLGGDDMGIGRALVALQLLFED